MLDQFYDEALKDPIAGKGAALLDAGKTQEGIKELRQASQEHPDNWYVWFCLGSGLRINADTRAESLEAFKQAGNLETVSTYYRNTAVISGTGVMRQLEQDNIVMRALQSEETPTETNSKCKRCGYENTITYKVGWRKWVCLDCVHELMREARR